MTQGTDKASQNQNLVPRPASNDHLTHGPPNSITSQGPKFQNPGVLGIIQIQSTTHYTGTLCFINDSRLLMSSFSSTLYFPRSRSLLLGVALYWIGNTPFAESVLRCLRDQPITSVCLLVCGLNLGRYLPLFGAQLPILKTRSASCFSLLCSFSYFLTGHSGPKSGSDLIKVTQ